MGHAMTTSPPTPGSQGAVFPDEKALAASPTTTEISGGKRRWRFARRLTRFVFWTMVAVFSLILCLRWFPPPTSMFMLIRHGERLLESEPGPSLQYRWTPMSDIPAHMALSVVAAEDQHFPDHWGFDMTAIRKAIEYNDGHRRVRGGSTISQQVVKNLFLWSGRSYIRKGLEAGLTLLVEALWPKERILEIYLNIAEFGDGIYGVHAAAERFFHKVPQKLTRHEAALLAAVLPSPRRFSPLRPTPYLLRRAQWIERQMTNLGKGYLDEDG